MPRQSVAIRLGTEGKETVKNDFNEIGTHGETRIARLRARVESDAAAMERAIARAAKSEGQLVSVSSQTPVQVRVNQMVGTGFGDPRGSAAMSAAFFADMENRARALLGAIDPLWAAQQRANAEIAEARLLFQQGAISADQLAMAERRATESAQALSLAHARGGQSVGALRAGTQQLSFQVGDVVQQLAMGVNPMVVFGQQAGQTAQAIQLMTNKTTGFIGFLGGPWGAVLIGAVTVLGFLTQGLFNSATASAQALDASEALGRGQSVLGRMFDLSTGRINENTMALRTNALMAAANMRAQAETDRRDAFRTLRSAGNISWGSTFSGWILGDPAAQQQSANVRNVLARLMQRGVTPEQAINLVTRMDTSRLQHSGLDIGQAIANSAQYSDRVRISDEIRQSVMSDTLAPSFFRGGAGGGGAADRAGGGGGGAAGGIREIDRAAEEAAQQLAQFRAELRALEDELDPSGAAARDFAEEMAKIAQGEQTGVYSPERASFLRGERQRRENRRRAGEMTVMGVPVPELVRGFEAEIARVGQLRDQLQGLSRDEEDRRTIIEAQIGMRGLSLREQRNEIELLQQSLDLHRRFPEAFAAEIEGILGKARANQRLQDQLEELREAQAEIAQFGGSVIDEIFDVENVDDWGEAAKRVLRMILQEMLLLAAINPLKNALFGQNNPTISSLFNLFGSAAGAGGGKGLGDVLGVLTKMAPGAFAGGTEYAPGGWAILGENGPERAWLAPGTKVTRAADTRRLMAANDRAGSVSMVFHNDYRGVDSDSVARIEASHRQLREDLPRLIMETWYEERVAQHKIEQL